MTRSRIWKFGADVDTDVLAPGAYMKQGIEVIAQHCLEAVRPEFAEGVRPGDLVVAGPNFGIGSSREQAAAALVHLGIQAVVAPSYGGLFFRNAFNVGLLPLTCPQAQQLQDGDSAMLDLSAPAVIASSGLRLECQPIPDFLLEMVQAGGLLPSLKLKLAKESMA